MTWSPSILRIRRLLGDFVGAGLPPASLSRSPFASAPRANGALASAARVNVAPPVLRVWGWNPSNSDSTPAVVARGAGDREACSLAGAGSSRGSGSPSIDPPPSEFPAPLAEPLAEPVSVEIRSSTILADHFLLWLPRALNEPVPGA